MPRRIRPRGGPRPRSFWQFKKEVGALLYAGHSIGSERGKKLIKAHEKWVKGMWRRGRPPCAVSDVLATKGLPRRRRYARDADDPKEGDVYESKGGNRWRVVSVSDKGVEVERAGHRTSGKMKWSRGSLKGMREVEKKQLSLFGNDPSRRRRRLTREARRRRG